MTLRFAIFQRPRQRRLGPSSASPQPVPPKTVTTWSNQFPPRSGSEPCLWERLAEAKAEYLRRMAPRRE